MIYRNIVEYAMLILLVILLFALAFTTGWSVHAIFKNGGTLIGSLWLAFVILLWFVLINVIIFGERQR